MTPIKTTINLMLGRFVTFALKFLCVITLLCQEPQGFTYPSTRPSSKKNYSDRLENYDRVETGRLVLDVVKIVLSFSIASSTDAP